MKSKLMTAQEAAELIKDGEVIATSGFTPAGYPKVIPIALAEKVKRLRSEGIGFSVSLYTGASVGDELDGELARARIIKSRMPYQSNPNMRLAINKGEIEFTDYHLSHVAQIIRSGFIPKPTIAIIEAVEVTNDGKVYFSSSGGTSATYMEVADQILIEKNSFYGPDLIGYHDIFIPKSVPNRQYIPIHSAGDRIGQPFVQVPLDKIVGIVETCLPEKLGNFPSADKNSEAIANHILGFLKNEKKKGRLPEELPYQSGVGNIANAVLACMGNDSAIKSISLYTEVIQDSIFQLLQKDKLKVASTCSLTFSSEGQKRFKENIDQWRSKFIIRQQEISNNPEIIRRLGIVAMNTALEMDIFGNVNSTHVLGSKIMNGIGGSGDFTRNSYLSFFMTPSIAKEGKISSIVPMVSHVDHNEHSTQIFVTEQGLADLRGLNPVARARAIIKNCAHPDYKPLLNEYLKYGLKNAPSKHTPHVLEKAFELHIRFQKTGSMLPE
jgi:succinyl-CoA:acetate CoA-transferase